MIIRLLFIIFLIFIIKFFIIKFTFKDYFNFVISFLLIFFSYIFIISGSTVYMPIILILALSLVLYSYFNLSSCDKSLIIFDGNIDFKNMIKSNYSLTNLFNDLKKHKISYLDGNICAFLKNGKLDFYYKNNKLYYNIVPLIIDGSINNNGISFLGKRETIIEQYLNNCNILISDVLFAFYYNSKIYIIKK